MAIAHNDKVSCCLMNVPTKITHNLLCVLYRPLCVTLQTISRLNNEMIAMETAVAERLGYLQRYKVNVYID